MPEAACTSTQFHVQTSPDQFAAYWNASQAIAAVQLARGRELAVPARQGAVARDPHPAVRAGHRHPQRGAQGPGRAAPGLVRRALDHLGLRPVRGERPLLPGPAAGDRGRGPARGARVRRHARRSPSCASTTARSTAGTARSTTSPHGVPHLRVENRLLAAGPTVADTIANAAFYFGLVRSLAESEPAAVVADVVQRRRGELPRRRPAGHRRPGLLARRRPGPASPSWCCAGCCRMARAGLEAWGVSARGERPAARHHRAALPDRRQRRRVVRAADARSARTWTVTTRCARRCWTTASGCTATSPSTPGTEAQPRAQPRPERCRSRRHSRRTPLRGSPPAPPGHHHQRERHARLGARRAGGGRASAASTSCRTALAGPGQPHQRCRVAGPRRAPQQRRDDVGPEPRGRAGLVGERTLRGPGGYADVEHRRAGSGGARRRPGRAPPAAGRAAAPGRPARRCPPRGPPSSGSRAGADLAHPARCDCRRASRPQAAVEDRDPVTRAGRPRRGRGRAQRRHRWAPSSWATCPSRRARPPCSRAIAEAKLRGSKLVVVNSHRGGQEFDGDAATPGRGRHGGRPRTLDEAGVELRRPPARARLRARRGPDQHRRGQRRRADRDRPAPPLAGRQAHPRQQRPARAARRPLPGAGGQGRQQVPRGPTSRPVRAGWPHGASRSPATPAADQVLDDSPFALLAGMMLDQQYPHGARLPRPGQGARPASARSSPTRSRRPTRRSSRRCAPPRRRSTASRARWRPGCRSWRRSWRRPTAATRRGCGPRPPTARTCSSGCMALPGFGKQKAQIFVALLAKQLGVRPEGWEAVGRGLRPGGPPLGRRRRRRRLAAEGARLQEGRRRRRPGLTRASGVPGRDRMASVRRTAVAE